MVQSVLNHRLNLKDSNPISFYKLSPDIPLIAAVIARGSTILNTFNLLIETFIIWLIIDQITVIIVRPNKEFINCNLRSSWKNIA